MDGMTSVCGGDDGGGLMAGKLATATFVSDAADDFLRMLLGVTATTFGFDPALSSCFGENITDFRLASSGTAKWVDLGLEVCEGEPLLHRSSGLLTRAKN